MMISILEQLETLKADYESVSKRPWQHFFCPMLYRDEETELCRGHVINQAFENSDRTWIVQRKDVDNLFGTLFESGFLAYEQKGDLQVDEILTDKRLSSQFKPTISHNDQPVDFFVTRGKVPEDFSQLAFFSSQKKVDLALKISPTEMEASLDGKWEVAIDMDFRLPVFASVLKSAHLTLFHMLGYRYALSAGGYFFGKHILGEFFLKAKKLNRLSALKEAKTHFREFQGLARPVIELYFESDGTLTDNTLFLCTIEDRFWAFNVLVRAGSQWFGVLVPILENPESVDRFVRFLDSPFPEFPVKVARMRDDRVWEIQPETKMIAWPPADID